MIVLPNPEPFGTTEKSRYYFDIRDGHRLIDPAGLDSRDNHQAKQSAKIIARQIAEDAHPAAARHI